MLASTPAPALEAQARRNLASLHHAWARADPAAAEAHLATAIAMYEALQPECALELAGAYGEAGKHDKARAIYERTLTGGVTPDPRQLLAQTNYALMKKDAALAGAVCGAWEAVAADNSEIRSARLKALSVRAYLLLSAEAPGALGAYRALQAFAAAKGLPLDAEAEHNAGVAAHMEAVKGELAAGAALGGKAPVVAGKGGEAV